MPTYEYQCDHCGYKFEEFQKMNDARIRKCPKCKRIGKVERLISSGAGFIFKGSGFYTTDYRSEGYKKQAKAEKPSSTTPSKSTDSSFDKQDVSPKK